MSRGCVQVAKLLRNSTEMTINKQTTDNAIDRFNWPITLHFRKKIPQVICRAVLWHEKRKNERKVRRGRKRRGVGGLPIFRHRRSTFFLRRADGVMSKRLMKNSEFSLLRVLPAFSLLTTNPCEIYKE